LYAAWKKEFPYIEENKRQVKTKAQTYLFQLFSINKEEFVKKILEGKEPECKDNWIIEGDVVKIPLPDGTYAIVDKKYEKDVRPYQWYYFKNKYHDLGVIAMDMGQVIKLHTLISNHKKTEYINKNKRDCRKENLRKHRIEKFIPQSNFRELGISLKEDSFRIRRRIKVEGVYKQAGFAFCFGSNKTKYKSKEEAYRAAKEMLPIIKAYSKAELLDLYYKHKKAKIYDAIRDWSIWDDGEISIREFKQMGTSNKFQDFD
jgi:hypothetical protein